MQYIFLFCRITTDTKAIARGCSINSDGITDKNVVSIQDGCTSEDRSTPCQLFPRAVLLVSADERHTSQDSSTSNPPGDHSEFTLLGKHSEPPINHKWN